MTDTAAHAMRLQTLKTEIAAATYRPDPYDIAEALLRFADRHTQDPGVRDGRRDARIPSGPRRRPRG